MAAMSKLARAFAQPGALSAYCPSINVWATASHDTRRILPALPVLHGPFGCHELLAFSGSRGYRTASELSDSLHDPSAYTEISMVNGIDVAKQCRHQVAQPGHLVKALLEHKNGITRPSFTKAGQVLQATKRFLKQQPNFVGFIHRSQAIRSCTNSIWQASVVRSFSSTGQGGTVEVTVPFMGDSITDGTIASALKKPGDRVEADEVIVQIETDKVTIDVRSTASGIIDKLNVKEGDTVSPGFVVATVAGGDTSVMPEVDVPTVAREEICKASEVQGPPVVTPPAPPSSPRKTEEPKVVHKQDNAQEAHAEHTSYVSESAKKVVEPQLPPKERERRVPMTRLRKRVAARLKDSQNTFALLTTFNEVDMTNLLDLRSQYNETFQEKHGVKLGLMSCFVKAAVSALEQLPVVNAVIDGDDIIYRDYIDISIAVGTKKGLVVPVIRNAAGMNCAEIEKTINSLAVKANDGTISIDEMAGGTFTISNGGVYGSLLSTPIINPPQSAILGMHTIQKRPMVVQNAVVPRPMMYIALTYDHRLIDGREAVVFLRRVKDVVEDPRRLLLDI